jgi:hypothetical protein
MADTRFPSFLRVAGSSSPPAANPQVERIFEGSDPLQDREGGREGEEVRGCRLRCLRPLGPALFLENLDAKVNALFANVDAIGTRDDSSVPV